MSEEKKEKPIQVELKPEDRELLKSAIEAAKPKEPKQEKTHEHTHFKVDLDYLDKDDSCPECKKGLEDFGKSYMRKVLKERKDLDYECEECGTPVGEEEEECPTCGSKNAVRR